MVLTGFRERFGLFEHEKKVINKLKISTKGNIERLMVNSLLNIYNLINILCFLSKINK